MELTHLIAFNLALLAALLSPGPAMLMAIRTTLASGRRAGILFGIGLGATAAGWTAAALLGLNVIFQMFPFAYMTLKVIGAAYLVWLAISTWRHASEPIETRGDVSGGNLVLAGALVNLANPKSVLFASAVLLVIFPPDMALSGKALIVLNQFVVESLAYLAFATLLSTRPARDGFLRLKPGLDRVTAAVLGALGLRLLLDRS
ncbi:MULTISPECIES: LysE family translocator [unclassified Roseovarius]|uniref:LysE family translocator n=1 Tax=unclassified Roseovarius TaxID=2614913 RepID=UPI00273F5298|nr:MULTISPECIES: LysE family translocator [unclassified Roseovarius]